MGTPLVFLLALSPGFPQSFDRIVHFMRPISPLAWLPLGLVIFQKSEPAAIFTIALCAMWPTVINTAVGVRSISQDYLNVGRVLKLSRFRMLTKIIIPASLPYVFTGYRLSLGLAWLVIVASGLLTADAGDIVLDGERVSEPGPERGIVFQQYSLLPWMTVHENVALAVDAVNPGVPARERRRITDELVGLVNLTPAAWKRPRELSGGMRQRVAVARGLAMQPKLLLMDEPFSALDALTRATLQEIRRASC